MRIWFRYKDLTTSTRITSPSVLLIVGQKCTLKVGHWPARTIVHRRTRAPSPIVRGGGECPDIWRTRSPSEVVAAVSRLYHIMGYDRPHISEGRCGCFPLWIVVKNYRQKNRHAHIQKSRSRPLKFYKGWASFDYKALARGRTDILAQKRGNRPPRTAASCRAHISSTPH